MKALHADPEFAAKASARMKALHADRLSWCAPELIKDYRLLVHHLGATEARKIIEAQMAEHQFPAPATCTTCDRLPARGCQRRDCPHVRIDEAA